MKIESLSNAMIKKIVKLRDSSKERKERGLFIIEGRREISLAQKGGVEIENLIYCQDYIKKELAINEEKLIEVTEKVFDKISYRENPDGFLAMAKAKEQQSLSDIKLSGSPLLLVLEGVEKPGNLGAILRTADAGALDAVIINDLKTDLYNPNVIRASQGAVFTVKTILSSVEETIKFLRDNKVKIFATAPEAEADYAKADYKGGAAIVMGSEDKGLSQNWLREADEKIKISMRGRIDSLNVSVSAAVVIFEALRQRDKSPL